MAVPTAVSLPAGQVSGGRPSPSIGLPGGHVLSTSRRAGHLVRCVLAASCCQLVTSRHSAPYPEPIPAERPSPATCLTRAGEDHLQLAGVRENARDVIGRYRCRWRARFVSRADAGAPRHRRPPPAPGLGRVPAHGPRPATGPDTDARGDAGRSLASKMGGAYEHRVVRVAPCQCVSPSLSLTAP